GVVAGGASGIGLETARVLALRNVHVIIAARNRESTNEAKHLILKDYETARVDVLKLDLSSINSIKAFVNHFNSLYLSLNILINNVGVMFCPYQLSEDGIEMQFATNHLAQKKKKERKKHNRNKGITVNLDKQNASVTYPQAQLENIHHCFSYFFLRTIFKNSSKSGLCTISILLKILGPLDFEGTLILWRNVRRGSDDQ
ncbi:hypothetical protein LOK49_LG05G00568, partial [Camellia lanceoleosa]